VRRSRLLSLETTFTRYCPETGEEVEIDVEVCATWLPGEPGSHYDPPIPPGMVDVRAVANGRNFPLGRGEVDWAAEQLGEGA
jgi:hypothetical protein